ncbi:serine hydrolase [candidate division KSB1 bacterium]|nr:serine hydrolase [candidate division KSB1 bacterium]
MMLITKFKKRIKFLILFFCLPIFLHCESSQNQAGTNKTVCPDISGCWKGKPINQFGDRNEELRLISLKPDGNFAITLIYEPGPRSRVWEYDIDITCQDSLISWEAHTGHINVSNDTMQVLKEWKGERTNWIFTRYQAGDDFMRQLDSARGKEYMYQVPDSLDDGWKCADLATVGIDQEKIVQFMERIAKGKHGEMHSILIVKDGKLVLEEYFATRGKRFGPVIKKIFREKPHHLASTTKGVLSTLTGIAIDQGFIHNVEAPIYQYLPEYASSFTEGKKAIRVQDLLTMTAGWEWDQFKYALDDPRNNGTGMWRCEDVIKYVLERPLDAKPGEKFNYTNGVPTVMGAVLKIACGMDVPEFAEQKLFHPLGITDYLWTRYQDGTLETDGGLALRSRDLAKIGQLFLNNGNWQGKQIVSEKWVHESTEPKLEFGRYGRWHYGYYWMQVDVEINDQKIHSYFAPGDGGQLLAVFPDLNMVIVMTAGNYGTDVKAVCFAMIRNYILPALRLE